MSDPWNGSASIPPTGDGIDTETMQELASRVGSPPPGTLDPSDSLPTDAGRTALFAAIIGIADSRRFAGAVRLLLDEVIEGWGSLSDYDRARYWHVRGVLAFRAQDRPDEALHAFANASRLLASSAGPAARGYRARVHDSLGQLLHQQGRLLDARHELETALAIRQAEGDSVGLAWTLGSLGRLCLDLGDAASARDHLAHDLAIVQATAPASSRLLAQVHGHLGSAALALGRLDEAGDHLAQSLDLARRSEDPVGIAYALVGLGRLDLAAGNSDAAQVRAREAATSASAASIPPSLREELRGAVHDLSGDLCLRAGDAQGAASDFEAAHEALAGAASVSPVEVARVSRGWAKALDWLGRLDDAAARLREALTYLDATAADAMREEVEGELRARHPESWLLHSAGRFVGQRQIETLLDEAGRSGFRGERRDLVVLFTDVRGFTTLSERLAPEELVSLLNDLLARMTRCVERHGGAVDKFIGDAVMAIFSGGGSGGTDSDRAVRAALSMQDELEWFNQRLPRGTGPLAMGVGIHRGPVVAGLIGSPQRRSYTVIGDVVNTASRLEGMTKQLGASVLVSEDVAATFGDAAKFVLRPLGRYQPKGRASALGVYDVMAERDGTPIAEPLESEASDVRDALGRLTARDFGAAATNFERLARASAGSGRETGYSRLADQARRWEKEPPPAGWGGEIAMTEK